MVNDTSAFRHSARCNDDHRSACGVELLGLVHAAREANQRETEQLVHLLHETLASIVRVRVHLENARGGRSERRVDDDGDLGYLPRTSEFVKVVDHLLRAADGERGNENLASSCGGFTSRACEVFACALDGLVVAVAVC